MAKTNPTGVRFDEDLLNELRQDNLAQTPQGALSFLESYFRMSKAANSKKENKEEKKDTSTEPMPEGLNWKEKLEWNRIHKKIKI